MFFKRTIGQVKAVDGISLHVHKGQTVALVGESGCGKSTTARAILRLLEPTSGRVVLDGVDITALGKQKLRKARRDMQIVFQDPYASLNPRMTIRQILSEKYQLLGAEMNRSRRSATCWTRSASPRSTRTATRTSSPAVSASASASPARSR